SVHRHHRPSLQAAEGRAGLRRQPDRPHVADDDLPGSSALEAAGTWLVARDSRLPNARATSDEPRTQSAPRVRRASSATLPLVLHAYGASDRGPVRASNQDCFGIDEQLGLCVIADGMGGHNAGEVAARIVVDALLDHV